MVQTEKMKQEDKTPTLYNFYDNQYNFTDLSRIVDSGMNEHISTLKNGKKYEKEFRDAVANIMSGVKDGTITFGNGRYNDSLGRYSNAEDRNKDVYGWAANYIYNSMQKVPQYIKYNNSKKYDNTVLGKALAQTIFGTDNGNIQYFWDVDPLDPSTNTRGINERIGVLNEAISQMDVDDLLNDYSDIDRASARQDLQQASQILKDGISPGEHLKLSRIFGGIDWNNWLRTDFSQQQSSEQQDGQDVQKQSMSRQQFFNDVLSNHPVYNGELSSQILNNTQSVELENFAQKVAKLDNNKLQAIPFDRLDDDSKGVYLDVLVSRRLLPKSDGVFILPNTEENETVLTYNPKSRVLARKRTHELSYFRKKWINEYISKYGSPQDQLAQYFTEFKKNGGILKAQEGTMLPYIGNIGHTDQFNWYNNGFSLWYNDLLQQAKSATDKQAFANLVNNTQSAHSKLYSKWDKNRAYLGTNNDVGQYQSGINSNFGYVNTKGISGIRSKGYYVDPTNPNTSDNIQNNWNPDNYFAAQTDDRRVLGRNGDFTVDQLVKITRDFNRYGYDVYLDDDNYYKLRVSNYEPKQEEIEGLKNLQNLGEGSDNDSYVFPTEGQESTNSNKIGSRILNNLYPDLAGIGRLALSLRTNNKVARTLNRSLKPVLKDTYERYSPITGAFGEMSFRNRQAADLRRQASKPFTSDASLQLAGQLEADRQARDLEYQGFLADDKEIKRTQEAALARQEDNMARRSDVANFNRASMNQTNREKAQLEATRLKSNWQSIDNFLQGIESRLRQSQYEKDALARQVALSEVSDEYQRNLGLLDQKFKLARPNATIGDMLADPNYIQGIKDFRRRLQYENNNVLLNGYRTGQYSQPLTYEQILNRIAFSRKGGSLHPNTMYLINKVIKNESNT